MDPEFLKAMALIAKAVPQIDAKLAALPPLPAMQGTGAWTAKPRLLQDGLAFFGGRRAAPTGEEDMPGARGDFAWDAHHAPSGRTVKIGTESRYAMTEFRLLLKVGDLDGVPERDDLVRLALQIFWRASQRCTGLSSYGEHGNPSVAIPWQGQPAPWDTNAVSTARSGLRFIATASGHLLVEAGDRIGPASVERLSSCAPDADPLRLLADALAEIDPRARTVGIRVPDVYIGINWPGAGKTYEAFGGQPDAILLRRIARYGLAAFSPFPDIPLIGTCGGWTTADSAWRQDGDLLTADVVVGALCDYSCYCQQGDGKPGSMDPCYPDAATTLRVYGRADPSRPSGAQVIGHALDDRLVILGQVCPEDLRPALLAATPWREHATQVLDPGWPEDTATTG